MSGWHAPVGVLAGAAVATTLFLHAFVRLRRRARTDRASWSRAALFAGGLTALVLPLVSPLDDKAEETLSAHMLQHVLLGDVAPLLIVLAIRGPLALFLLPSELLKWLASSERLRTVLTVALRPRVTFAAWSIAVLSWHIPIAYDAALRHTSIHVVEHACFITAGLLAWTQLIDPMSHHRLSRAGKILFALGLFAVTQPLMAVFLFATGRIYAPYADVDDQRIAALVMVGEQVIVYGIFIAIQLRPLLHARRTAAPAEANS